MKIVMPRPAPTGGQIVIGALNTTAATLGFARCVCDSINRRGDLDL